MYPFAEWEKGLEPEWHKAYINLKQNRTKNYKDANLENALMSLSALYSTVVHLCTAELKMSIEERHLLDFTQSLMPCSKLVKFTKYK